MESIYTIAKQFQIKGNITEIVSWGNGLVNHTYRIYTSDGNDYLLQQMNTYAYPNIDGMMQNIYNVTEALNSNQFYFCDGKPKTNISVIPTRDGKLYFRTSDDRYFRLYNFIKDTYSIEKAETETEAYSAGVILGQFHYLLRDYPVETMVETVNKFHDPIHYYEILQEEIRKDVMGRVKDVAEEIAFFEQYVDIYDYLERVVEDKSLPWRVCHNDTKINNFMFSKATGESICMVDLDTLMPGFICTDFGDAIRSIMCTGKDSGPDTDITRISFRKDLYDSYLQGFLAGTQGIMSQKEIDSLATGAKLICLESGMRYLADYLRGDLYLKIHYEKQNLIKTRMHIQLVKDLMTKL